MRFLILLILFLILAVLGFLFYQNTTQVEVAATKNRYLENKYLDQIRSSNDIAFLKKETLRQFETRKKDRKIVNRVAGLNFKLICAGFFLIIIAMILTARIDISSNKAQ